MKGNQCADREKKIEHTSQEDAESPILHINFVIINSVIYEKEKQDVDIVKNQGDY